MRWAVLGLLVVVGGSGEAVAQQRKRVADFEAKNTDAADEGKSRARSRMPGFAPDQEPPEEPFPWMMVGLISLVALLAAPFGYVAWRNSAKELEVQANAYAPPTPRKRSREAPPNDA